MANVKIRGGRAGVGKGGRSFQITIQPMNFQY